MRTAKILAGSVLLFVASSRLLGQNLNGEVVVDGSVYAQTNAGIQAAVDAAPSGGTVRLPVATYVLSATAGQQILVTKPLNIICDGWGANLQLAAAAGAVPLLHIAPSGSSGFVAYGIRVQNCHFSTASSGLGTYAIQVDLSTSGSVSKLAFDHNYVEPGFGTGALSFNNLTGTGGYYDSHIQRNLMHGSVLMTRAGDSIDVNQNEFWVSTVNDLFTVDFYPGSSSFRLNDNTFTIPVHFGNNTLFPLVDGNEFEPQTSTLTGSNSAMLDLDGSSSSLVTQAHITNNTFQMSANSSTLNAVRLNYATQTEIGGRSGPNNFLIGVSPAKAVVTTANSSANRLNHNVCSTSTFSTILNDVAGNTLVTDDATASMASPLDSQGSGGGTNIYGFSGVELKLYNGCDYLGNGAGQTGVASCGSIPAIMPTGYVALPATSMIALTSLGAQSVSGTGACSSTSNRAGGAWAGTAKCTGSTGASTLVITPGITAPNGWSCWASDLTTGANVLRQSATGTTAGTFAGTVNGNDVLTYGAVAY